MDERTLIYAPRAQRDLDDIPKKEASRIVEDLDLLSRPPWPPGKVKPLNLPGVWEIKTGDFRTIFWPRGKKVVILRVIYRRDLREALRRIDFRALLEWLRVRSDPPPATREQ